MVIESKSIVGSAKGLRYQSDDKGMSVEISRHGLEGDEPNEWHKQMQKLEVNNERSTNKRFSVVLAPSKEVSGSIKTEDWEKMVDSYLAKMGIDKENHQFISHLHTSTDDPHVHLTICRIPIESPDLKYTALNDNHIGVRSGTAADKIAKENGWRTSKEIGAEKRAGTSEALRYVLKTARNYNELSSQMLKIGYVIKLSENEVKGIYGMRIRSQSDTNAEPSKNAVNNSVGYKLSELTRSPARKATFRISDISFALNRNMYNSMSKEEQIAYMTEKSAALRGEITDVLTTVNRESEKPESTESTGSIIDDILKPTFTTKPDDDLLKKKRKKRF